MEEIESAIRTYISKNILFRNGDYPYPDNASFLAEGITDSTNVLELVLFVEESYNLSVADQDIVPENFDSVAQLAAFIRRQQGAQLSAAA